MTSSSASELPNGWIRATLGELRLDRSASLDPTRHPDETFELYSVPSFPIGVPELAKGRDIGSTKKTLEPGTVIVCKINPRINRVWVVGDRASCRKIGSSEWIPFFPLDGLDPHYLAYYCRQDPFRNYLASNVSGVGGSLMRVRPKTLDPYPISIAPHAEQARIVEALDSYCSRLDDAVAGLERAQRNLKRYRASVLQAAVEGRLAPAEAELARAEGRDYEPASVLLERILAERRRRWEQAELERIRVNGTTSQDDRSRRAYREPTEPNTSGLPELPNGWCWTTVDAVGDVLLGRRRAPEYRGELRPYLRVANVRDDRIDYSVVKRMPYDDAHAATYLLKPGDILVSEGQSPELIGQSAIYRGGVDGLCFQSTLHRFRPLSGSVSSEYAQLVFRSHVRSGMFQRFASITTNIAHLVLNRFKSVPFPLPPESEQDRIVAAAARLLSVADVVDTTVGHQVRRGRVLRNTILRWAFEGKLVDQDPADEPAAALLERIGKSRDASVDEPRPARGRARRRARA